MKHAQEGFVLVIVLWVLAILSIVTIGLGQRSWLDRRAARYALDHTQAMMAAQGAVQRGVVELRNKAIPNSLYPEEGMLTHYGQSWARRANLLEDEAYFPGGEAFANDDIYYLIQDDEALINVNVAPEELLKELKQLSRSAFRSIMKRRIEETAPGVPPTLYQAPEELRYERGITEEDWFGNDEESGLKDLITTSGDGKININTASREVLACIPDVEDEAVEAMLGFRNGPDGLPRTEDDRGFKSFEEISREVDVKGDTLIALQSYGKLTSNLFTVRGIATRRQGAVRAVCAASVQIAGTKAVTTGWREEHLGP